MDLDFSEMACVCIEVDDGDGNISYLFGDAKAGEMLRDKKGYKISEPNIFNEDQATENLWRFRSYLGAIETHINDHGIWGGCRIISK